jgi:uncharacterized protein
MASLPRVRVQARTSTNDAVMTGDSFVNFQAALGYGTNNQSSGGTYGFNPVSRNRTLVEWMYRGSWMARSIVDCVADDMTRAGVSIKSDMPPDEMDQLQDYWNGLQLWHRINQNMKWARLYGGSVAVIMIDGQKPDTPLDPKTVRKGQFKGLLVLDRWMVWPHLEDLVTDLGPSFGRPKFYEVTADARSIPAMKVHYSRCIRFDGIELPYWQRIQENEWGLSVLEPLYDRMIAYDSVTQGAAQLVYRAHLRIYSVPGLREIIGQGGAMYQGLLKQIQMIRMMQTNEGITVIDGEDQMTMNTYTFAGLSDMMLQFGQQLSGGSGIPATRLFGQSPSGMNATGESDMRNYHDAINADQETRMRDGLTLLYDVTHRSRFGEALPDGFSFKFNPLYKLTDVEKGQTAASITQAVGSAYQEQIISRATALKELRQSSDVTGIYTNITDEDIEEAEDEPPQMQGQLPGPEQPGQQQEGEHPVDPNAERNLAEGGPDEQNDIPQQNAEGEREAEQEPGEDGPDGHSLSTDHAASGRWGLPMRDFHGLTLIVETNKGERRLGYHWTVSDFPCAYGYISGTNSAEGANEQFDCFIGDYPRKRKVWVIEQVDPITKLFNEYKAMLGFKDRDDAVACYQRAFSDGSGSRRMGQIREMDVATLKNWLNQWQYGKPPPRKDMTQ